MKSIAHILCLALLSLSISCAEQDVSVEAADLDPGFFNLPDFVNEQSQLLSTTSLRKTVSVNSISESQDVTQVDWAQELAPFAQSNIDRPALWDKYSVDTISQQGAGMEIRYAALDSSLFTRSMTLLYQQLDGSPRLSSVSIENRFSSYVADTEQLLSWQPGRYRIDSRQEARLLDPRELSIVGEWSDKR